MTRRLTCWPPWDFQPSTGPSCTAAAQGASGDSVPPRGPLERLNGEIRRRSDVVGISPNEAAVTRLIGALPPEQNDEWVVQRARTMALETIAPLSDELAVSMPALAA